MAPHGAKSVLRSFFPGLEVQTANTGKVVAMELGSRSRRRKRLSKAEIALCCRSPPLASPSERVSCQFTYIRGVYLSLGKEGEGHLYFGHGYANAPE